MLKTTEDNPLSSRESEVLELLAQGKSNKEIASELVISVNTVKVHISNIFQKLEISSRAEAIMYALEHGFVESPLQETPEPEVITEIVEAELPGWLLWARRFWWLLAIGLVLIVLSLAFILSRYAMPTKPSVTPEPFQSLFTQNRWQKQESLSPARENMAAIAYKNQIFVIGGESLEGVSALNQSLDTRTNQWIQHTAKPTPVKNAQAVLAGGKIYIFGGETRDGKPTNSLESYDIEANTWKAEESAPIALSRYAVATFEGKFYFFGGWDGKALRNETFIYDTTSNKWNKGAPCPVPFADAKAVLANDRFLIIGGTVDSKTIQTVRLYDARNQANTKSIWSEPLAFFEAQEIIGAQLLGESVVVFSKVDSDNLLISYYSSQNETWTHSPEPYPTETLQKSSLANLSGAVYFIGGRNESGELSSQIVKYQAIFTIMIPAVSN